MTTATCLPVFRLPLFQLSRFFINVTSIPVRFLLHLANRRLRLGKASDVGRLGMNQTLRIQCGERLSIERVESLYSEMELAVREARDVELLASQVQFCDTAGLQLLLSLQQALQKQGLHIRWQAPSEVIYETSALLGLQNHLGLPEQAL
jgi:ABC-type transporter Mla MlaB component